MVAMAKINEEWLARVERENNERGGNPDVDALIQEVRWLRSVIDDQKAVAIALDDAIKNGTVPWEEVKRRLGL
jgi:hypothetical protein